MNVNNDNIDYWERLLIKTKQNNLLVAEKRIINDYDISDLNEYINLIKSNINDELQLSIIIR